MHRAVKFIAVLTVGPCVLGLVFFALGMLTDLTGWRDAKIAGPIALGLALVWLGLYLRALWNVARGRPLWLDDSTSA